jgi:hypothetical protein
MEPTGRRETGSRPSALKRYGPFVAILVVIAIVAVVLVVAGGSDDDGGDEAAESSVQTEGGPTIIDDSNRDSIEWGETCDVERGRLAIPYTYAPPCVEPFDGDNGGATAQGVTADSIKVVVYQGDPAKNPLQVAGVESAGADTDLAGGREVYRNYFDLFSRYYELYGRTIDLQFFTGTGAPFDEVTARADAKAIADMKPFAVLNGASQTPAWSEELAANGIMCLGLCSLAIPEPDIREHRPYLLAATPTPEQAGRMTGRLVTEMLAGEKAEFAGDDLQGEERVFGLVRYDTVDGQQRSAYQALKEQLDDGDVDLAADLPFQIDLARAQENARTMIAKLKDAGVTSVVFTGDPLTPVSLTKEATAQNYFPEWIIGSNVLVDTAIFARTFDQEQWQHAFGLALTGARVNLENDESHALHVWATGEEPAVNTQAVILADLDPLFTGIHLAGPKLTPEAYEAGLHRYPITGGTPLAPTLSWGDHGLWPQEDLGGLDDTGLLWWDPEARGQDEVGVVGPGLYRYTRGGKRWLFEEMPSEDPGLFDRQTSVTVFEEVPAEYAPPDYPSPAK